MAVPWSKKLSGRADVYHFRPTNGPLMLLHPNRAGVPLRGQPRATVVFMQPPASVLPPLPPPPPRPRPPVPPITVVYHNAAQTCTNTCPEGATGAPISATVPANTYSSETSQEEANAEALAAACAEAAALRISSPCVYANGEVECCNNCVEGIGEPICVTTPAGTFTSTVSLAAANAEALAAACAQAAVLREMNPCEGASMIVTMESQLRNCELCGFSEFTTPSTPPKKYRVKTAEGLVQLTQTEECTGGGLHAQFNQQLSGSCQYDADTCAQSGEILVTTWYTGFPEDVAAAPCSAVMVEEVCFTLTNIPTSNSRVGTAVCCNFALGPFFHTATGSQSIVLTVEDTDAAAIARSTPIDGSPTNVAKYESRTAFTFAYQVVAIDFDFTGLSFGVDYRVTLPLTTENYGGGSPVVTEETYDFTAAGPTHNFSDIITAAIGKQVTVGAATLEVVP